MMNKKLIVSAYGSHNGGVAYYYDGKWGVIEAERWLNSKNIGLTNYMAAKHPQIVLDEMIDFIFQETGKSDIDIFYSGYLNIKPSCHVKQFGSYDHHNAHAATAFYQSPYREALVFSFDGGGDNGFFNVYTANRQSGIKLLEKFNQDLGFPYMVLGDYLKDIKKESLSIGNLVYAGKIMGLCSYGNVREEWVEHFEKFYEMFNYFGSSYLGGAEARFDALTELFKNIGIDDFNFETSRYEGQVAYDIAATSQKAFENQFFKFAKPYLDKYPNMPVALAGGCALNVLLNSKLLKLRNNQLFVPPNVNDCGIAVGGLLWHMKPETQVDLTYSGVPILDKNQFGTYIQEYDLVVHENVELNELAQYIADGNIVGMIQGNSEHGSRALGNRSIICNPVGNMKDILNEKVKHREWYRPFAPIVRLEDTSKYFEFDDGVESRHMVYVADVREEWRDKLPAITHNDNTARLQTVTRQQNQLIYDLLGEVDKLTGHGVILNTSFNVDGKPILTRLSDALKILRDTELDAVYYDGKIICKQSNNNFKEIGDKKYQKDINTATTINILSFKDDDAGIAEDIKSIKSIIETGKQITIIIPEYNYVKYTSEIPVSENIKYFSITARQHYYHDRLTNKVNFKTHSTVEYSKFIKILWCKEVIQENVFNNKYQLFVNLDEFSEREYAYSVTRDVELLSEFAQTDDKIIITSKRELPIIFDADYLKERFKVTDIEKYPTSGLFCGNLENLEWFCNNYEGMLLWYVGIDKIGNDYDYLLISTIENESRYKFLEA